MNKRRVEKKLLASGGTWFLMASKFCDANDPLEHQMSHRKTWHIHPDASYLHGDNIKRFDTLAELNDWLDGNHPEQE